jgi:uncharacterized FAD-dependent dehydrogenase
VIEAGGGDQRAQRRTVFGESGGNLAAILYTKDGQRNDAPCECAVLAIGHSARYTYEMLRTGGVAMEFKPFAAGLRIEHPQRYRRDQYGRHAGHEKLGAPTTF